MGLYNHAIRVMNQIIAVGSAEMPTLLCRQGLLKGGLLALGLWATVLIAGCAQPNTWTKPGITEAGFENDMAICRRQASSNTQPSPFAGNDGLERSDMRDRLIRRCMESRGYRLK